VKTTAKRANLPPTCLPPGLARRRPAD